MRADDSFLTSLLTVCSIFYFWSRDLRSRVLVVFSTLMNYWLIVIISSHFFQYHSICILPHLLFMKSHQHSGYTVSGEEYCAWLLLYPTPLYIIWFQRNIWSKVPSLLNKTKINLLSLLQRSNIEVSSFLYYHFWRKVSMKVMKRFMSSMYGAT